MVNQLPFAVAIGGGLPSVFVELLQGNGLPVATGREIGEMAGEFADHIAAGHPIEQAERRRLAALVGEGELDAEKVAQGQGGNTVVRHVSGSLV